MRWLRSSEPTERKTSLARDERGMALVYVTLLLPVIIGFALLAVDIGRLSSLQTSLQNGADSLALAGAAELDQRDDSIVRAKNAIATLVTTNRSLFASTVVTIDESVVEDCYLTALPASDVTAINPADCLSEAAGDLATSSLNARFVQIRVVPQTFDTIFPATYVGAASNTLTTTAEAAAGFQAAVCDFTPMFICNPYEPTGNTNIMNSTALMEHFDQVNYPDRIGRQINMKQTGGTSAQYFPGNFGFLIPEGTDSNPGAGALREAVGKVYNKACFVSSGVELRTGAITSIRFGFNTRFDMYDGPLNSYSNDPNYRPALNVRKGGANDKANGKGSACNPDETEIAQNSGLLRDTCFATNTCPNMGGRMGDHVWDKATYWSKAHNGAALPAAISGANVSRYDVYKYELEDINARVKNDSNNATGTGAPFRGEIGYPRCYSGASSTLSDKPDRRIFYAAILNCQALDASTTYGPIRGGSGNKLPALAFGKFFLTEPVGGDKTNTSAADGDVWAELVGLSKPGDEDGVARDIVQLYR